MNKDHLWTNPISSSMSYTAANTKSRLQSQQQQWRHSNTSPRLLKINFDLGKNQNL